MTLNHRITELEKQAITRHGRLVCLINDPDFETPDLFDIETGKRLIEYSPEDEVIIINLVDDELEGPAPGPG